MKPGSRIVNPDGPAGSEVGVAISLDKGIDLQSGVVHLESVTVIMNGQIKLGTGATLLACNSEYESDKISSWELTAALQQLNARPHFRDWFDRKKSTDPKVLYECYERASQVSPIADCQINYRLFYVMYTILKAQKSMQPPIGIATQ
jgi:hypothetical protein